MGLLGTLAVTLLLSAAPADTAAAPFPDDATRLLVARAQARRAAQDSVITDYRAQLRYRLTVGRGRRKFGTPVPIAVEEQVATVQWQRRNDLRIDVIGRRERSPSPEIDLSSSFEDPWFVPRDVDDSVRVLGLDFPASGALHPLAGNAELWYRYAILDSLEVQVPGGAPVKLIRVEVVPRRGGRALVAGRLWLDAATAETVRFAFRYVGDVLWVSPDAPTRRDSADARRASRFFRRFAELELDLEYGRQEGRFWMPARQTISGRISLPIGDGLTLPFEVVTTFDDYEINRGAPIAFTLGDEARLDPARLRARRDSIRAENRRGGTPTVQAQRFDVAGDRPDGRFEIHRPSNAELAAYDGWTDSLRLGTRPADAARVRETAAELSRVVAALPAALAGERRHGFGYERLGEALRFNRVQGTTLGAGYRVQVGAFSQLYGTARFGLGDERLTGRLALVRDAPGGRLTVAAFRDVASVDPLSTGRDLTATVNAIFAAHDYADYALVTGGSVGLERGVATGVELQLQGTVQREASVLPTSRARVNDFLGGSGEFQPGNPAVTTGTFGRAQAGLRGIGGVRWGVTGELVAVPGGDVVPRAWADLRLERGRAAGVTLRAHAAVAGTSTASQLNWRLGSPNTVRGFPYGVATGAGLWAAQLDVAPFPWPLRPVFFADAGWAGPVRQFGRGDVRVAAGAGLALYSRPLRTTFVRLDVSRPVETGGTWRLDLVIGAVR